VVVDAASAPLAPVRAVRRVAASTIQEAADSAGAPVPVPDSGASTAPSTPITGATVAAGAGVAAATGAVAVGATARRAEAGAAGIVAAARGGVTGAGILIGALSEALDGGGDESGCEGCTVSGRAVTSAAVGPMGSLWETDSGAAGSPAVVEALEPRPVVDPDGVRLPVLVPSAGAVEARPDPAALPRAGWAGESADASSVPVLPVSAAAMTGAPNTAPIPSATANAPTRPTMPA
jgi:hypothetical protein